jgi:hypothetical protein
MGRGYVFGAPAATPTRRVSVIGAGPEGSAARLIQLMAHVTRWLDGRGLGVRQLRAGEIEAFVADRRLPGMSVGGRLGRRRRRRSASS